MDSSEDSVYFHLPTKAEVPWGTLQLGEGYDPVRGQSLPSAFERFDVSPSEPASSFEYDSVTIGSKDDVEKAIGLSSSISASFFKVGVDSSAKYLQSARFSETSCTTIIRVASICQPTRYKSTPKLTKEAVKVLGRGTEQFYQRYGQYFVGGQVCQSNLFATMTHTAASRKELSEFKGSLTANYKITSGKAASEYVDKMKSHNIRTEIHIYTYGYSGPKSAEIISEQDLSRVLHDFLQNSRQHTPLAHTALLEHYSWIDPRFPVPTQNLQVSSLPNQALHKCLALEMQCRSSSLLGMQKLLSRISEQRRRVLTDDSTELQMKDKQMQDLQAEVEKYSVVQRLLDSASEQKWGPPSL